MSSVFPKRGDLEENGAGAGRRDEVTWVASETLRTSDDDDGNRRVASRASCAALIAADAFAAAPIAISAEVEVEVEDDPPLKLLDASRWRALAAAASLAAS
jgi:hypothetical protein